MGAYIAKQPNGLYCRFSSVVDSVTHWNMTEEDYINFHKERYGAFSGETARDTLKNHLKPFNKIKDDFIPANDSVEEFQRMLKSMGDEEGLSEKNLKRIREWQEEVERGCNNG